MDKEFIPYEQALTLKELGFDGDCFAIWSGFDEKNFSVTDTIRLFSSGFRINDTQSSTFYINDFNSRRVAAPTYSQAFRWFRVKYKMCHWVYQSNDESYFYSILKQGRYLVTNSSEYKTYEETELKCLKKLIEIVKNEKV